MSSQTLFFVPGSGPALSRGVSFVDVVCQPACDPDTPPRPGMLCGAWHSGICLYTGHRFRVGEVVVVEVPPRRDIAPALRLQVQVISVHRARVLGNWVFGCALVRRRLSAEEVRVLTGAS
jgi:hypothetical protein